MDQASLKLTVREAQEVYAGLQNLDTYQKVVKLEDSSEKVVNLTYSLGRKAKWAIVKNLRKLKEVNDDFIKLRDDLIKNLSDGTGVIKEDEKEKIAKLTAELEGYLDEDADITGLLRINLNDLNLDECPVPNAVLNLLYPIIYEQVDEKVI
jgi:hypothetical protein